MRKSRLGASVMAFAVLATGVSAMAAPVTIFDDALENNFSFTVPARESVDTSMAYEGSASVKLDPSGGFDQLGFAGGGLTPPIPSDAGTLTMAIYVSSTTNATANVRPVANFVAQLATGSYPSVFFNDSNGIGSTSPVWTIDGVPGTTLFTRDAWHVLRFDLPAAFDAAYPGADPLVLDSTNLASMNVQTNGDSPQSVIHLDSAAFVGPSVPEPATAGLLGAVALAGLSRRRTPAAR